MYYWALICITQHRGAFCQFLFRWIYYCHNSESTGNETGKTHLCVQWFIRKRNTSTYEIGTLASAKQTNASCSSSSKILFFGLVEPTNEYLTILCD